MTYPEWLMKYKGKRIEEISFAQHTEWSEQYRKWKLGNIEKVYP